ncbi:hypothetical protein BU16DRAFT_568376 [Lophium mytilinum]|uniref:General transcription and DNA repair factor IIH subunit TFB5 n=1 Tax=Lophium mytilinum TaxID=390894 RepID=A0A6A6Q7Y6_9PEZI|nr:hypothetical protein BU16DRAFT_568376 [Lophium mytilinum]
MVRAQKGQLPYSEHTTRSKKAVSFEALPIVSLTPISGVLIKCDASIKAIIVRIDADRNDIIVEDLDDEHLLIKEAKLPELKQRLSETLKATLREQESSNSE